MGCPMERSGDAKDRCERHDANAKVGNQKSEPGPSGHNRIIAKVPEPGRAGGKIGIRTKPTKTCEGDYHCPSRSDERSQEGGANGRAFIFRR